MNKSKILIIARDFPPYFSSLGGVIRILKMAEYFGKIGIDSVILSAKGHKIDYFGYEDVIKCLDVRYIDDFIQKRNNRVIIGERKRQNKVIIAIKKVLREFIIPDKGIFMVRKYIHSSIKIINGCNVHNIIITSPPFSMQLIGIALKRKYKNNINLIIDYRDGWNVTKIHNRKNKIAKVISLLMEKKVLINADYITYCSEDMITAVNKNIFDVSSKSLLVMNGFDDTMINPVMYQYKKNEVLRMGYFGVISDRVESFRNPSSLLRIIHTYFSDKINISFYGIIDLSNTWKSIMGDQMKIYPEIPHKKVLDIMNKYDVLLVLHTEKEGGAEVLTGKLFDYFAALRPVFVVGPDNMAARELVQHKHLGYTANFENENEIRQTLEMIYRDWEMDKLITYSYSDIEEFSRQRQYQKIVKLLY